MIHTVQVNSMDQILLLFAEQDYVEGMDRYRSSYFYRGMPNVEFKLLTSLRRNCKDQQKVLEPALLRNFTKYAIMDDPLLETSIWRQMIIGRHHGLPTRLLDWSHSPLIGLHFATSGISMDSLGQTDLVLWRIDMREIHSHLPEQYQAPLKRDKTFIYTIDMLNEVVQSLEQYDEDMGNSSMVLVEPPSIDPRIINQYGYFSIVPSGMDSIEDFLDQYTENTTQYIIDRNLAWRIRDMLDQLNITERCIYPGLDGLSTWLARHFYVK